VRLLHTGRIGCARARNYGAERAAGRILFFADAHLDLPGAWAEPLAALLERPQVGAAGPAISVMHRPESVGYGQRVLGPDLSTGWLKRSGRSPYPVPFLGSGFLAMRREVFQACGGFDEGLLRWGGNDLELGLRLWSLGYECWLDPRVEVAHLFREKHPYQVNWTQVLHNLLRIALIHFGQERQVRVIEALKNKPQFAAALALVTQGDAPQRRQVLAARRRREDGWFFDSFGMHC
jgi:GT2 family glycosyltransferase